MKSFTHTRIRNPSCRQRQHGVTFVELIISIVVISVVVTGLMLLYTTNVSRSADPMIREQALAIAEAYMDEIASKHFDDPDGTDGEGARAQYDDVDDYAGFSGTASLPDGSSVGLDDYTVSVAVGTATLNGISGAGNVLRIDVTVTHTPTGESIALSSFRTEYGP